jgi:membrane-bound metal-dependent hydrolase YbcI (DUF457 family)
MRWRTGGMFSKRKEATMPLPIGHTAIGLAAAETIDTAAGKRSRVAQFIIITVLANLPDIDMLAGLFVYGNGEVFHRGPTHSLLFALVTGYGASHLWRIWRRIPRLSSRLCILLVSSHIVADLLLTSAPVSLLWPLESNPLTGHSGWGDVIHMVAFQSIQDAGIVLAVLLYVLLLRTIRSGIDMPKPFAGAKRWLK